MKTIEFVNTLSMLVESESAYMSFAKEEEKGTQIENFLEKNLPALDKEDLFNLLSPENEHESVFFIIPFISKKATIMFWKILKQHNYDMNYCFKNFDLFRNKSGGAYNHYIANEALELDITNLLYQKNNKEFTLLTTMISSLELNSLIDKKEIINKSCDAFKLKLLDSLLSSSSLSMTIEQKDIFVQIITNIDNWQQIQQECLRAILSVAALSKTQKERDGVLKTLALNFNEDFFNTLNDSSINIEERLIFTECVPSKSFIKKCAQYQNVNLKNWNHFINISSTLSSKKLILSEKMSAIAKDMKEIELDFLRDSFEFMPVRKAIGQINKDHPGFCDFLEAQIEKKEIEVHIFEQDEKLISETKKRI